MLLKYKGKVITKNLKYATSPKDQLLGLILKSNPRYLLFKTRFGIHTFLLKEKIDLAILDKDFNIVTLKQNLPPNQIYLWNPKFFWVLELPNQSIKKYKLELNQKIQIKTKKALILLLP